MNRDSSGNLTMTFEEVLQQKKQEVDELVFGFLPEEEGYAQMVKEAANYSVRVGGKRLRPLLLLETNQLFCEPAVPEAKPLAVALELIHTYSLVHDDLPAMDNDDLRRGNLTTHKKYGEAVGILAGDALLNLSMQVAVQAVYIAPDPARVAEAIHILYDKAGMDGMIGGQTADVLAEKQEEAIEADKLDYIYRKKTGALIEAAMMIGCALAPKTTRQDVKIMERIAGLVGMAFQIQDDILDVEGDEETLGKPIGSDARNEKSTYVTLFGMEQAKKEVNRLTEEASELLAVYAGKDSFLQQLIASLAGRSM